MLTVVLRRVLWTIPFLVVVSLFSFVLASLAPGSTAESILGIGATPDAVEALNRQLGLDRPVLEQYWSWLTHAVRGDFGNSVADNRAVIDVIGVRLPATLSLTVIALLGAVVIGVGIGLYTAVRDGFVARVVDLLATVLRGVPNFWLALVLIALFAVQIRLFPVSGYVPFATDPALWISSLVLPVIALGVGQVALVAIVVRAELLTVFRSDFIRSLRANGISGRRILLVHALKNAAGPVLTIVSLLFVGLLGGTIPIEQVFGIGGLGSQMVTSVGLHDLPVIQGLVVFYTGVVVVVFLINDLAHSWVNPKVVAR